ncbi:hypothetical protein [Nocardioides mangrovicus]|uniref:hypothetical protein n=1 Tax=Nocardioides mangrovicus TaxID=2478913 RepID=UPI001314C119|nr:hypothetical protein [Nocardioides mangrovicus]
MAEKVFLHLGLPKTATTYLQTLMWGSQAQMREQGVLLPGEARREHLWASRVVRGEDSAEAMTPWQRGAWDRLRAEMAAWEGHAVISHEFFAAASTEQARAMVEALAPAEVHLVLTAREPLGLFTASWQESLKNRETTPMAEYAREVSESPSDIWNWRTLDLTLVLARWAPEDGPVPADRVHVLPLPGRTAPREEIWHRFAVLLGLDSGSFDLGGTFPNESMGVVEAETLRRINVHLDDFSRAIDRGTFIRTFLADERLVPRGGERFWPGERQIQECRSRGKDAVELVQRRGFQVIGDPADLLVPDELPRRRQPDSVTDTEVAEVAVELVGTMLGDYRALRHERRALRQEREDARRELEEYRRLPLWRITGSRVKGVLRRLGLLRG